MGTRHHIFALTLSVAVVALFTPVATAAGPGGWNHLGNGGTATTSALNGHVNALFSDASSKLYVGGPFTNAGGKANADYLASWNGAEWSAVNKSVTLNGAVDAIAVHAGNVYVGGEFTNVGGNTDINYLAEWNGTTWSSPCSGSNPITAQVAALQIIGNTLYVGGAFQNGGNIPSADYLVACDLTTGAPSSTVHSDGDFNSGVAALTADSNGTLYAGGGFINLEGTTGANHVAYYSGNEWHQMGGPNSVDDRVRSLAASGTNVYVGTDAVNVGGIAQADHIAKWDAQSLSFSAMGSDTAGTNGWFNSFAFLNGMTTTGSLVFVTGSFQNANSVPTADDVAFFDGTAWHPLGSNGSGNGPFNSPGNALVIRGQDVIAGGGFTDGGGDQLADSIGSYVLTRPDARIGTKANGPFSGNNVYSATGAGETKSISVKARHKGEIYVDIQNDGLIAKSFTVGGPSGSQGFHATYFNGATNVTSKVLSGTFSTGSLLPQQHLTLTMVVKVAAQSSASQLFVIRAQGSGAPTDAVRATVKAT